VLVLDEDLMTMKTREEKRETGVSVDLNERKVG